MGCDFARDNCTQMGDDEQCDTLFVDTHVLVDVAFADGNELLVVGDGTRVHDGMVLLGVHMKWMVVDFVEDDVFVFPVRCCSNRRIPIWLGFPSWRRNSVKIDEFYSITGKIKIDGILFDFWN